MIVLLLMSNIAFADGIGGVFRPVDMVPPVNDPTYSKAYEKAVEAAAIQSGVWGEFLLIENAITKSAENTANEYLGKEVVGLLGYTYASWRDQGINLKLSDRHSFLKANHGFRFGFDSSMSTTISWNF